MEKELEELLNDTLLDDSLLDSILSESNSVNSKEELDLLNKIQDEITLESQKSITNIQLTTDNTKKLVDPFVSADHKELVNKIQDELKLEGKADKQSNIVKSDLEKRLDKLREFKVTSKTFGKVPAPISMDDFKPDETEGWCCICNEDGVLVCIDCDDDVYCKRCFDEGHKFDVEYRTHKTKKLNV